MEDESSAKENTLAAEEKTVLKNTLVKSFALEECDSRHVHFDLKHVENCLQSKGNGVHEELKKDQEHSKIPISNIHFNLYQVMDCLQHRGKDESDLQNGIRYEKGCCSCAHLNLNEVEDSMQLGKKGVNGDFYHDNENQKINSSVENSSHVDSNVEQLSAAATISSITKEDKAEVWTNRAIATLISKFEAIYTDLQYGNFMKKHWEQLATAVNKECGTNFTAIQCSYKLNRLKKFFKKERVSQSHRGCQPFPWPFYESMQRIVDKSPKSSVLRGRACVGKKGESENSYRKCKRKECSSETIISDERESGLEKEKEHKGSRLIDECEFAKNGVEKKKGKKAKQTMDSLSVSMVNNMKFLTETMKELEQKRMEHENRRLEKILDVQLQVANLFAPKQ